MARKLGLGAAVGLLVGVMSWRGNQSVDTVSVFPDGITVLVLVGLLALAIHAALRREPGLRRSAALRAGTTIGAATGVVFGLAIALLEALRFTRPSLALLSFGFLTAFAVSLASGAVLGVALSSRRGV